MPDLHSLYWWFNPRRWLQIRGIADAGDEACIIQWSRFAEIAAKVGMTEESGLRQVLTTSALR